MIVDKSYALTIDELSEEVARLLKANDLIEGSQQDNRISATPDMRTIRYYSSLGLIDRPTIEGRVAKYNRRHILQLLAIKILQKDARPLSEIQERLYGLSEAELEAMITSTAPSASESSSRFPKETIRPVYWREIVIQPGLKIMADQSWMAADADFDVIEQKLKSALEALRLSAPGANGEEK